MDDAKARIAVPNHEDKFNSILLMTTFFDAKANNKYTVKHMLDSPILQVLGLLEMDFASRFATMDPPYK